MFGGSLVNMRVVKEIRKNLLAMAKRVYGKWSTEDMSRALMEFKEGSIKLNECCRKYEIPKKTFLRHFHGKVNRGVNRGSSKAVNGRQTALPSEAEKELVEVILKFEESMFGLTITEVRKLAFQVLIANPHLPNPFNKEKKIAGKKWYYAFMKRNPTLSLRQPENVSIARARGFNKENVFQFFDVLTNIVDENGLNALNIFNVDESGFSTVQKKSPKIVAQKGRHQVGAVSSGERGVNTTIVCCTSASGNFVPPMIIFKRLRMHPSLKFGAPPGSIVEISDTGYINTELFIKWLKHFIDYVKPYVEKKVLLVLDGHTTHSKNFEAIQLARLNGVLLLQLPGHTTHRLQPLDVAIFKPFKSYYDEALSKWLRTHEPLVTQFQVSALLSEAYSRAATVSNAMSGFKATGIWPVDRNLFSDADFVPGNIHSPVNYVNEPEETPIIIPPGDEQECQEEEFAIVPEKNSSTRSLSSKPSKSLRVTIHDISPLPRPTAKQRKIQIKGAQKAEILTSSPYKNKLQQIMERKSLQIANKLRKNKTTADQHVNSSQSQRRAQKHPENNSNHSAAAKKKLKFTENAVIEFFAEDWYCFICEEGMVEDMVQCQLCKKWAHETCAGVSKKIKRFKCDCCTELQA